MNHHYQMSAPPPPPPGYPMGADQYGYGQGVQDSWGVMPPMPGASYPPQPPPPGMGPQDWSQPPIPPPNSELANQNSAVSDSQRYSPTFSEPEPEQEREQEPDDKMDTPEVEKLPPAPPSKWTNAPEPPEITREELERMRDSFDLKSRDLHRRDRDRGDRDRGDRDRGDRDGGERDRRRERYRRSGSRSPRRRKSRSRDRKRKRSPERSKGRERERKREVSKEKKRSPSREPEKKVVYKPRAVRSKPSRYWDIAPKGFEHISPLQFKAMQAAGQLPTLGITTGGAIPPPPPPAASQLTRQARRLYVGNIPFGITEDLMVQFINEKMHQTSLVLAAGNPVMSVQVNHDKNFAFIEFRSVEECSNALAFDGLNLQGQALRIRRPSDYKNLFGSDDEMAAEFLSGVPGVVSTIVADGPNKIFIGGLPNYLTDDQVKDLLISFGDLRAFNLVKDTISSLSKGYAFFEYKDPGQTELAIAGLNNMELGDKKLIVQRASVGARSLGISMGGIPGIPVEVGIPSQPTCILCLFNMVTPEELQDIEEYEDIYEDVKNECSRSGKVLSLEIPRPIEGVEVPGVGKIFVEFASIIDATKGSQSLSGRKFAGRIVVTSFYDESKYRLKDFI